MNDKGKYEPVKVNRKPGKRITDSYLKKTIREFVDPIDGGACSQRISEILLELKIEKGKNRINMEANRRLRLKIREMEERQCR